MAAKGTTAKTDNKGKAGTTGYDNTQGKVQEYMALSPEDRNEAWDDLTEEEKEWVKQAEEEERKEAAEAEARAKLTAAKENAEVANLAEKEADRLKNAGGEPIRSVAGAPSVADPRETRPPSYVANSNASATNPALASNDAVPAPALADVDPEMVEAAKAEGKYVVPMHGNGPQPAAG